MTSKNQTSSSSAPLRVDRDGRTFDVLGHDERAPTVMVCRCVEDSSVVVGIYAEDVQKYGYLNALPQAA